LAFDLLQTARTERCDLRATSLGDFMSRKKTDMQDVWYCHLAAEQPEIPA
jgi:hypothetical protein